ncbi:PilZ domain-containing protein [Paraglaciecola mesophila]|uniref:PilZ domain-containing protein n=1 Tax=Paraglaciecola mesophila TaxID=197222 RepID=A0ABU9SQ03_9ALTE
MHGISLEEKQQQFNEFFTIEHAIRVNFKTVAAGFTLPDVDDLGDHMPYAFRVASEATAIDAQALRPLRNMGEHAIELANFLNAQSRKIDLLMSLVLQQQDDPSLAYESVKFGGGGIIVKCDEAYEPEQIIELKLFLKEEASAIFCYGEVIECQQVGEQYHVSLIYNCIREEDQDLLVRASLHLQTAQLRKRAKQQKND